MYRATIWRHRRVRKVTLGSWIACVTWLHVRFRHTSSDLALCVVLSSTKRRWSWGDQITAGNFHYCRPKHSSDGEDGGARESSAAAAVGGDDDGDDEFRWCRVPGSVSSTLFFCSETRSWPGFRWVRELVPSQVARRRIDSGFGGTCSRVPTAGRSWMPFLFGEPSTIQIHRWRRPTRRVHDQRTRPCNSCCLRRPAPWRHLRRVAVAMASRHRLAEQSP